MRETKAGDTETKRNIQRLKRKKGVEESKRRDRSKFCLTEVSEACRTSERRKEKRIRGARHHQKGNDAAGLEDTGKGMQIKESNEKKDNLKEEEKKGKTAARLWIEANRIEERRQLCHLSKGGR